jgi:hypothetical protein
MMKEMGKEQKVLIAQQLDRDRRDRARRRLRLQKLRTEIAIGIGALVVASSIGVSMALVVEDRINKYPQLGTEWIPKSPAQQRREAAKKIWIGR